jgi:rubrerythrin
MSREKQIEEMARTLKEYTVKENIMASYIILENYAEHLYNAGYRKEIQGEWLAGELPSSIISPMVQAIVCSKCRFHIDKIIGILPNYCPHCGAKMKG